jgi:RNA polymerase sigma-70 factor (ECF subfamily)
MSVGHWTHITDLHREESTVVAELRTGSEEAFNWLIAQYHQPIYSLLARSLQDPADAADLTQDVFLKVFRGIRGFHEEASLKTWIYRIALHEASNRRRWWKRHRSQEIALEAGVHPGDESGLEASTVGEMLADANESPFDAAAHAEVRERVELALRDVPEPFRTTVVLRDIEGFSYEEMAEVLEISLGTVKSRLIRGRLALKARLAEYVAETRRPVAAVKNVATGRTAEEGAR